MNRCVVLWASVGSLIVTSCGGSPSRYQDTLALERPPIVAPDPVAVSASEAETVAPEVLPSHHGKGLHNDVYQPENSTAQFNIKRSFTETWKLIHRALQFKELKITDSDRSKGVFYVNYGGSALVGKIADFLGAEQSQSTYLIQLTAAETETQVKVFLANKDEDTSPISNQDGIAESIDDHSESLADLLYDTLRADVKED